MTLRSCDYTDAMENALLTAENHGTAYRLLPNSTLECKNELVGELKLHHVGYSVPEDSRITPMQASTIANDVARQWISDSMTAAAELKAELKALLLKYDAQIYFEYGEGSDTYGLHGERLVVLIGDGSYEAVSVDGYALSQSDL